MLAAADLRLTGVLATGTFASVREAVAVDEVGADQGEDLPATSA
jgi:hypothetical protein